MTQRHRQLEARLRVVSVALEPALILARVMGLGLDDLQAMVASEYFRQFRLRGLPLPQIARKLGKSDRTVASLSKRAQARGPLLDQSRRLGWQREVLRALTPHALTREQILSQTQSVAKDELDETLERLVASGLIDEDGEMFRASVAQVTFALPDLEARLESLRHLLTSVTYAVYQRFFRAAPNEESFARVLTFSASPEQLSHLANHYPALRDTIVQIDGDAHPNSEEAAMVFIAVRAPKGPAWRHRRK